MASGVLAGMILPDVSDVCLRHAAVASIQSRQIQPAIAQSLSPQSQSDLDKQHAIRSETKSCKSECKATLSLVSSC